MRPVIIVHGGAGAWKDERIPIGLENVEKAARAGWEVLMAGGSALDAAEVCTAFMESCGQLNAGLGATRNNDGIQELDAMIIDGSTLDFGSVAAVTGIYNPISLARYVMEKTPHKFFAGPNAQRVYAQMMKEGYRKETNPGVLDHSKIPSTDDAASADTVGCVVVDSEGRIAATSSTGGIRKKIPGRVGDSPVMGAGAYANDQVGVAATGYGEHIMRVILSYTTAGYVEQGVAPQEAAERGVSLLVEKTGSEAGLIVADVNGEVGAATNAKAMPVAIIRGTIDSIKSMIVGHQGKE
ncbi:MAG: isoaspartyl peptidase/L-asparaginase [Candidatus Thorarchaeota archaeon]|nr:isoaspartyl peptidase/L-asparaginase [Candidatus Thorarchaeota archaeon]